MAVEFDGPSHLLTWDLLGQQGHDTQMQAVIWVGSCLQCPTGSGIRLRAMRPKGATSCARGQLTKFDG